MKDIIDNLEVGLEYLRKCKEPHAITAGAWIQKAYDKLRQIQIKEKSQAKE